MTEGFQIHYEEATVQPLWTKTQHAWNEKRKKSSHLLLQNISTFKMILPGSQIGTAHKRRSQSLDNPITVSQWHLPSQAPILAPDSIRNMPRKVHKCRFPEHLKLRPTCSNEHSPLGSPTRENSIKAIYGSHDSELLVKPEDRMAQICSGKAGCKAPAFWSGVLNPFFPHMEEYLVVWVNIHDRKQTNFSLTSAMLKILHRKILGYMNIAGTYLIFSSFLREFFYFKFSKVYIYLYDNKYIYKHKMTILCLYFL